MEPPPGSSGCSSVNTLPLRSAQQQPKLVACRLLSLPASTASMATILTLLAASCASLYTQLEDEKTLHAVLGKAEAFRDQPPLMQTNLVAVAVLCFVLVLKVRAKTSSHTAASSCDWCPARQAPCDHRFALLCMRRCTGACFGDRQPSAVCLCGFW